MFLIKVCDCGCDEMSMTMHLCVGIFLFFFFYFDWYRVSKAFVLTIPGGAQALGKEFPASAPWVIQGEIKFPQSDGHKGVPVATRTLHPSL
jgi:hypothetical protein